jgi:hypothetical protein
MRSVCSLDMMRATGMCYPPSPTVLLLNTTCSRTFKLARRSVVMWSTQLYTVPTLYYCTVLLIKSRSIHRKITESLHSTTSDSETTKA